MRKVKKLTTIFRIRNQFEIGYEKNNTAVILCGGKGTRLGSLEKKFQKLWLKSKAEKFYGIY